MAATSDKSGEHRLITCWEHGRAWANARCPCLHSDPVFPDLAAGESATLRGWIEFHDGEDISAAMERLGTGTR